MLVRVMQAWYSGAVALSSDYVRTSIAISRPLSTRIFALAKRHAKTQSSLIEFALQRSVSELEQSPRLAERIPSDRRDTAPALAARLKKSSK